MKKLLLGIVAFISLFSCDGDEKIDGKAINQLHQLSDDEIIAVSNMMLVPFEKRNTTKTFQKAEDPSPIVAYSQILAAQEMTMKIDSGTLSIMDNSYEENIKLLKDLNLISPLEITVIDNFSKQINTTHNFEKSINDFSKSILNLPLSITKKQKYINFIDGLRILNQMEPEYFKDSLTPEDALFGSCLSASIGVGIAFVGLATIEVGSFGLATGAAVVGFIWASAEWGKACKGQRGKIVSAQIKKLPKKIEFDGDGNILTEKENNSVRTKDRFFDEVIFNVIIK
ncbi:hypothetical protein [Flavobacterium cupreum]|uniref:hypothetical protein n=1 Tax=Flavobacterium cupreum TaxID=2133766 RepID=UPI000FCBBADD|nr:hypothetical protein [Flavobacterium cupreum]